MLFSKQKNLLPEYMYIYIYNLHKNYVPLISNPEYFSSKHRMVYGGSEKPN